MAWTDETAAAMCLGLNDQQHGAGEKLSSADPHMLAAYCFDLTRKLHYVFDILYDTIGANAVLNTGRLRRTLASIERDNARVEEAARAARAFAGRDPRKRKASDWQARAYALESIIRDQYGPISRKQANLIRRINVRPAVARRKRGRRR